MYTLYSLLTAAGVLLLSPYFLVRGLLQEKYLQQYSGAPGMEISARVAPAAVARIAAKNQSGFTPCPSAKFWPYCRLAQGSERHASRSAAW